jgi:hypothetical protein
LDLRASERRGGAGKKFLTEAVLAVLFNELSTSPASTFGADAGKAFHV